MAKDTFQPSVAIRLDAFHVYTILYIQRAVNLLNKQKPKYSTLRFWAHVSILTVADSGALVPTETMTRLNE